MYTTTNQFKLVCDFMNIAGQEVNTEPKFHSTKIAEFRTRLINEEIHGDKELVDSIKKDDTVGIVDGLCDILYVTYGALATYGLECASSIIAERPVGSKSVLMFKHIADRMIRQLDDSTKQYERGVSTGDMITISQGLHGIIHEVLRMANTINVDIIAAFEEVHKSNLSKFCSSKEHAIESMEDRILANDNKSAEYKESYVAERHGVWVILRKADNKILKGNSFFEPDLSVFA